MASTTIVLVRGVLSQLVRAPGTLLLAGITTLSVEWCTAPIPPEEEGLWLLGLLWSVLVGVPLLGGFRWLALHAARGGDVSFPDVLHGFHTSGRWLANVLVALLQVVLVLGGLVACVLPGIYLALRLAFGQWAVNECDMGPIEALRESWRITRRHETEVLVLTLVSLAMQAVGLLCCVVGVVPAFAVTSMAWGRLFDELRNQANREPGSGAGVLAARPGTAA